MNAAYCYTQVAWSVQKAYGRGSMGQLLAGLRRQMASAARQRVDDERHLVDGQRTQLSQLTSRNTATTTPKR